MNIQRYVWRRCDPRNNPDSSFCVNLHRSLYLLEMYIMISAPERVLSIDPIEISSISAFVVSVRVFIKALDLENIVVLSLQQLNTVRRKGRENKSMRVRVVRDLLVASHAVESLKIDPIEVLKEFSKRSLYQPTYVIIFFACKSSIS